jgi:hypothetical protein
VQWLKPVVTAIPEMEIGDCYSRQPRQKVNETPSQPISQAWWLTPVISARWEVQVEE